MLNIIYILLLIFSFIYISPIVDHFAADFNHEKGEYEIIIECIIQLIIIGTILYSLHFLNKTKFISNLFKLNKYNRMLIDLIFTIVFIGTQSNLSKKLEHVTHLHPIRNL